jgi:hypothetical protein
MVEPFGPPEKLQLSMLRAEHQKHYQMTIDFMRERLGEGIEHSNEIARMLVSPSGACCELVDLPEEFCGALGPGVSVKYMEDSEILAVLSACRQLLLPDNLNTLTSLRFTAYYTRRGLLDSKNCFCADYPDPRSASGMARVIGKFISDRTPLFFRVKCDATVSPIPDLCNTGKFMLFGLLTRSRLNPVVIVSYDEGELTDLSVPQRNRVIY